MNFLTTGLGGSAGSKVSRSVNGLLGRGYLLINDYKHNVAHVQFTQVGSLPACSQVTS